MKIMQVVTGRVARLALVVCFATACRTPAAEQQPAGETATAQPAPAPTPAPAQSAGTTSPAVLMLERGPCYGRCPVYAVALFADGAVHFDGRQHVQSMGIHKGSVPASDVAALTRRFQADFAGIKDSLYVHEAPGCGQFMTDGPSIFLSFRDGAKTRTVRLDTGCTGAPPIIRQLAVAVDSIARTPTWVVGPGGDR
ncbi:MAG TPA: DUF6438 domain-containing protein [Gemmatimonas sp.]|uniref:DUF6438 domain-containing protein n=1 Tax=Gemmatimonas sp. TaxID=1962908 RepID=UPI002EDA3C6B